MALKKIFIQIAIIILSLFFISYGIFAQDKYKQSKGTKDEFKMEDPVQEVPDSVLYKNANKAPVIVLNDTLLYIYGDVGVVTAKQRADMISKNIISLCKDALFMPDSLVIDSLETDVAKLLYMDNIVLGVTDFQSKILKKSKTELASEYRDIIIRKIDYIKEHSGLKNLLIQIGLSIVVIAAAVLLIKLLNYVFRIVRKFIAVQRKRTIKAVYNIVDSDKQIKLAMLFVKILKFLFIITVLYFCIFALFRIFPETKWLSDTLIGYIITPIKKGFKSLIDFIPDLIYIVITIIIFRFIFKIMRLLANQVEAGTINIKGFYKDWALPTYNIIKIVMLIFMIIIIFPHLPGAQSDIFKGVSVFLGVLFSLGSTSIIGNVISGLVITYMRPFKKGDRIKVGDFVGNVIEKSPLVTRIKTTKNEVVTIPNAIMMSAQTVNYTKSAEDFGLVLYKTVTVGYDVPWRKVHDLLIEAGMNTPRVMKKMKPFVLQTALDDFYVEYQINVYTREANYIPAIYSDLYKNIQDIFNREGIELISPHYHAHRDGSQPVMNEEAIKTHNLKGWPMKVTIERNEDD